MPGIKLIAMSIFLFGFSVAVAATSEAENDFQIKWFAGLGLTQGGDELAEAEVYYYDDWHDEDIRAGELVTITAGAVIYLPMPSLSIQASIGYHADEIGSYDDDIKFDRYPLELIPFYNFNNHRLGAGLSYHISPELDLDDLGGPGVDFDDALGWLIEYDYSFSGWKKSGVVLGLRYLWIDYDVDEIAGISTSGMDVEGDHVGIHINYIF